MYVIQLFSGKGEQIMKCPDCGRNYENGKRFCTVCGVSLINDKSSVDINLKDSKSNRHELEKLIQHYKGDELKLEAVKFLLENIDIHGCYRSSASDSLFQYMDSI